MVNKQNNDHEINDSIDVSTKTDSELSTNLVKTEEELTASSTKGLSEIDWQRFDDGS